LGSTAEALYQVASLNLPTGVTIPITPSIVTGSSSGNATFVQANNQPYSKRVVIYLNSLNGTATYTFPTPFLNTPVALATTGLSTSLITTLTSTSITVTGSTSSGVLILEGI
jgi:hypothetical protein